MDDNVQRALIDGCALLALIAGLLSEKAFRPLMAALGIA